MCVPSKCVLGTQRSARTIALTHDLDRVCFSVICWMIRVLFWDEDHEAQRAVEHTRQRTLFMCREYILHTRRRMQSNLFYL